MDFFLKHCPQEDTLHGQRIGYVRVSSYDQNPERQLEQVTVSSVDCVPSIWDDRNARQAPALQAGEG